MTVDKIFDYFKLKKEIADYFEQEYTRLKFKDIENIGGGVFNVIMEDKSKPEPVKINFSMTKL